jgi:glyoxylase-like metal-dependent hydrolase (beta-lactamase superfamily II)
MRRRVPPRCHASVRCRENTLETFAVVGIFAPAVSDEGRGAPAPLGGLFFGIPQIPERLTVAEALQDGEFELELQKLVTVDAGHSDTSSSTCLYVPSTGLLVGGDVVYNGIHLYLSARPIPKADWSGSLLWTDLRLYTRKQWWQGTRFRKMMTTSAS